MNPYCEVAGARLDIVAALVLILSGAMATLPVKTSTAPRHAGPDNLS